MRDLHPRQYQKPRVVGDQANVTPAFLRAPAKATITAAEMARRRTPRQRSNRPALRPRHILQMLAHRLFITQIVMMLDETIAQRLFRCPSHLPQLDGLDLIQAPGNRRHIDRHSLRWLAPHEGIRRYLTYGR